MKEIPLYVFVRSFTTRWNFVEPPRNCIEAICQKPMWLWTRKERLLWVWKQWRTFSHSWNLILIACFWLQKKVVENWFDLIVGGRKQRQKFVAKKQKRVTKRKHWTFMLYKPHWREQIHAHFFSFSQQHKSMLPSRIEKIFVSMDRWIVSWIVSMEFRGGLKKYKQFAGELMLNFISSTYC